MSGRRTREEKSGAGWLTTFNDLVTLLMVFFVLLFTMGSTDVAKLKQFQFSIMKGFGVLETGEGSPVGVIESFGDKGSSVEAIKREMIPEGEGDIEDYINTLKSFKGMEVRFSGKNQVMSLDGAALFESGSDDISPDAFPILNELLKIVKAHPYRVRIEGHTDNVPIFTERFESNWELSTARAVRIVKYFIQNGSIAPGRLSAVGYGELRPLVPNDTAEHRARNRRVEIVLANSEEE